MTHRTIPMHRRAARIVAATAALAAVAGAMTLSAAPAEAGTVPTGFTTTKAVTWVDGEGRQLMLARSSSTSLTIARDTAAGDPDPTWGTDGIRTISIDLPDGASSTSAVIAAADDGRLTLVHPGPGCTSAAPCDGWFQQVDGTTGATVAGPYEVLDTVGPWQALDDGSMLMASSGTPLVWRGPDGTERKLLPLTTDDLVSADVDAAGRLLVLDADGVVTRYPVTGPADLTVDLGCDLESGAAVVGASSLAPGFVVACTPGGTTAGGPTALRYDDAGAVSWTAASGTTNAPNGQPTAATVSEDGRAWVATRVGSFFPFLPSTGRIAANSAGPSGWASSDYARVTGGKDYAERSGSGVTQLRPIGDAEVALAEVGVCCQYASNFTPSLSAYSALVPYRPGPPVCTVGALSFSSSAADSVTAHFGPCPYQARAIRRPDSYRVEVTVGSQVQTASVIDIGPSYPRSALFTGIADGAVVSAVVTPVNAEGDNLRGGFRSVTVAPFSGATDFVNHQIVTLAGQAFPAATVAGWATSLGSGTQPGPLMEQLITSDGAPLESVEPVARIYRAAFLRDPDTGGLTYWVGKHRSGTRIATMAEQFARSSEFQRRYGSLTDRRYVEQVYRNVLGRPGDAAGIAFWTGRLASHRATRGAVLANFSESGEFVRKTNRRVQTITVAFLMLGRRPTTAELATWATSNDIYGAMPETVLATREYGDRIRSRPVS